MERTELEKLSTEELHDMAMSHARHHLDAGFLWHLIKNVPVARAAAGELDDADADVMSLTALLSDVMTSDEGDVGEQLRPFYIDYLEKHHH